MVRILAHSQNCIGWKEKPNNHDHPLLIYTWNNMISYCDLLSHMQELSIINFLNGGI